LQQVCYFAICDMNTASDWVNLNVAYLAELNFIFSRETKTISLKRYKCWFIYFIFFIYFFVLFKYKL